MDKDVILAAVHSAGGDDAFQIRMGDQSVAIVREQNDLEVVLTVPYEVHELFFEAEHRVSGQKIKGWFDYYGETEESDFEDDLRRFLFVLRDCDVRFDGSGNAVQYYHQGQWQYFFG